MPFSLYTSDDSFLAEIPLPGVDPDKIEVFVERNQLVVKAIRNKPEGDILLRELPSEQIERRLNLNSNVETQNIEAKYEQGLLSLIIAKRSKRIDVRIA